MNSIIYKCEVCGKSHNGTYGSGRFCGYKCRQKYASLKGQKKASEAAKLKCSKACECPYCNEHFESKKYFFKHNCLKKPKKEYTWVCSICNEQFPTRQKMREHRNTNHSIQRGFPASTHTKIHWVCSFCNKESYTPLSAKNLHEKYCKANPNALKYIGHKVSEETKKKISETCKKNKLSGGYRKGSGRGKKGTYKGYYCDSSWELAYVIYNLDHNIKFERNEELFPYEFNGEQHNYKPDFIENGIYVEIKGYFTEQVKAKESTFPFQLKYIDGKSIIKYLDYVEKTYGKNFISMYDEKTYSNIKIMKPKICKCCGKALNKKASLKKHQGACFRKKEEKEQKSSKKRKSSWNKMSDTELNRRKDLILNSGIDIMEFGWVGKMVKATGLSKHQIEDCVRHFNIPFFKRSSAK